MYIYNKLQKGFCSACAYVKLKGKFYFIYKLYYLIISLNVSIKYVLQCNNIIIFNK